MKHLLEYQVFSSKFDLKNLIAWYYQCKNCISGIGNFDDTIVDNTMHQTKYIKKYKQCIEVSHYFQIKKFAKVSILIVIIMKATEREESGQL